MCPRMHLNWGWRLFYICALVAHVLDAQQFNALVRDLYGERSNYTAEFMATARNKSVVSR